LGALAISCTIQAYEGAFNDINPGASPGF